MTKLEGENTGLKGAQERLMKSSLTLESNDSGVYLNQQELLIKFAAAAIINLVVTESLYLGFCDHATYLSSISPFSHSNLSPTI